MKISSPNIPALAETELLYVRRILPSVGDGLHTAMLQLRYTVQDKNVATITVPITFSRVFCAFRSSSLTRLMRM
jgi:hypothetical protein